MPSELLLTGNQIAFDPTFSITWGELPSPHLIHKLRIE